MSLPEIISLEHAPESGSGALLDNLPVQPLSFAQEEFWYWQQLHPRCACGIPLVLRLPREIPSHQLQQYVELLAMRHPALRTSFPILRGKVVQRVAPTAHVDVCESMLQEGGSEAEQVSGFIRQIVSIPFDIERGPLFRAAVLYLKSSNGFVVLVVHPLIADRHSREVLVDELRVILESSFKGDPFLPPDRRQFTDFAIQERERAGTGMWERHREFWRRELAGAPTLLNLAVRPPRVSDATGGRRVRSAVIPAELSQSIRSTAMRLNIAVSDFLLAAFSAVLHRYTAQNDLVVGVVVSRPENGEWDDVVGLFDNIVLVRVAISSEVSFIELAARVQESVARSLEHAEFPFARLVEDSGVEWSSERAAACQVTFEMVLRTKARNAQEPTAGGDAHLRLSADPGPVCVSKTAQFDLSLLLEETDDEINVTGAYREELFSSEQVDRLLSIYLNLLAVVTVKPVARLQQCLIEADAIVAEVRAAPWESAGNGETACDLSDGQAAWPAEALELAAECAAGILNITPQSHVCFYEGDHPPPAAFRNGLKTAAAWPHAGCSLTHLLVSADDLASLDPGSVPANVVVVVIGLPCFAETFESWKQRAGFVGVFCVGSVLGCAQLKFDGPEAVINRVADGYDLEIFTNEGDRQWLDVWGEIGVRGPALARLNRDGNRRVAMDPERSGKHFHLTGMVGRRLGNGNIEVAGFRHRIVRVGEMRVQADRFEALLRQHPALAEGTAGVQHDGDGAYLDLCGSARPERRVTAQEIGAWLRPHLNAAVGRVRIRVTGGKGAEELSEYWSERACMPNSVGEVVLAKLWSELLPRWQPDTRANFFAVGGSSITSIELFSRIQRFYGVHIPFHLLFENPTIAGLGRLLDMDEEFLTRPLQNAKPE